MFITELSAPELRAFKAFRKNFKCPLCNTTVDETDAFEMVKMKYASRVYHSFIHTSCLLSRLTSQKGETNG